MSRIALIGENSIEYIEKLIDIWNHGDCAVLINYQVPVLTAVEMMQEANVKTCYIEQKYYEKFDKISIVAIPYRKETNTAKFLPSEIYCKFKPNYSKDEAIVIYSSGTTGRSKGIILSFYALNTNADAIMNYMQPTKKDCIYIVKDLTHSSTITGELLVALKSKMPLLIAPVVVPPRFVLNNITKFGVSVIGVNPLLLSMYAQEYQDKDYDITSLKNIYVSGSVLNDKIYQLAHRVFEEINIYNVYGLSEAGPRVTAQRYDCCKSNSVGKPIMGVEVMIVDEDGAQVQNGDRGFVYVNSPSIFSGYVSGEMKHKSLFQGWLNTGDVGYLDENGELHIVGRVDDVIHIAGHKIYPAEVARKIQIVTDIHECSVTMVNFHDEDILCCLYVSDEEIQKDIKNKLSTVLLKYEIPKLFIRTETIHMTRNGKVSINDVKETIKRGLERRIIG